MELGPRRVGAHPARSHGRCGPRSALSRAPARTTVHPVIYLVVGLVAIVGLGKWSSAQQAADQRRELTALRRELAMNRVESDTDEATCRDEAR